MSFERLQTLAALLDAKKKRQIEKQIQQKQVEFSLRGRSKISQAGGIEVKTGSYPSLVLFTRWLALQIIAILLYFQSLKLTF